jgi:hypothetical protein
MCSDRIGFLKNSPRLTVAISRAQAAMYVIANVDRNVDRMTTDRMWTRNRGRPTLLKSLMEHFVNKGVEFEVGDPFTSRQRFAELILDDCYSHTHNQVNKQLDKSQYLNVTWMRQLI